MIVMTLRSLGVQINNFDILVKNNSTYAKVIFPWRLFFDDKDEEVEVLNGPPSDQMLLELINNLGYYLLIFSNKGKILKISDNFIQDYRLTSQSSSLQEIIPKRFFKDILDAKSSIITKGRIDNYRLWIEFPSLNNSNSDKAQKTKSLFNICGYLNKDLTISTIWIPVFKDGIDSRSFSEGLLEDIQFHKIIKPYLSSKMLKTTHEVIRKGKGSLPDELIEVTILFADIVGYTRKTEKMDPVQAVELLNIALGIIVKSINQHKGYVDKFMGDAVMAIFEYPLNAVIASVEIQSLFNELNTFRKMSEQNCIELRIGVHTGKVMIGNLGTADRKDWTVIGDVVNTASRLEKSSFEGSILVSDSTYNAVKDFVKLEKKGILKPRGREENMRVYFIKSVTFQKNGRDVLLEI